MGQYYYPVNLDDKEYLYSHDIREKFKGRDGKEYEVGIGLKLMEHSYIGNKLMNAVERLLIPGGQWHKKKLIWAGDYADHEPGYDKTSEGYDVNIHTIVSEEGTKLKPKTRKVLPSFKYLTNHSKKVVIDLLSVEPDEDGYRIHPLPLLVAEGNGRGGGDFHGDDSRIGLWARDVISLEEEIPDGYELVDGQFNEER